MKKEIVDLINILKISIVRKNDLENMIRGEISNLINVLKKILEKKKLYKKSKRSDKLMGTKIINEVKIPIELINQNLITNKILPTVKKMLEKRWVYMKNKNVIYDNDVVALYPDLNYYETEVINGSKLMNINNSNYKIINDLKKDFLNLEWDLPNSEEVKKNFKKVSNYPFRVYDNYYIYYGKSYYSYNSSVAFKTSEVNYYSIVNNSLSKTSGGVIIPIFRFNGENSIKLECKEVLKIWLEYGLVPKGLTAIEEEFYYFLLNIYNYDVKKYKSIKEKINILNYTDKKIIEEMLLNSDKLRADIDSYDEKILEDPNRGHWEIWETKSNDTIIFSLSEGLVARNPEKDIKTGGVVGIDFGTKSTVVVYQEDGEHTLPMRIGIGQYSKKIEGKHYENPTVMEFRDIENFVESYNKQKGRPYTSWDDLTISYSAFNSFINSPSNNYYSFFSELKQWTGDKTKKIRLKDQNDFVIDLPSFLEISDNNFINPIEIYAYYIGLFINNHRKGIYLDYILSFPVTYEKEIREKIRLSFEKGLKKSLPLALIENEEIMKEFRVLAGTSEPAAYAICALEEYGFMPENEEKIFYGIFDFGGGTTDFDFGIWKEELKNQGRYDYIIEYFGSAGDRYLGGENLLELLAFEVFKDNQDKLRGENIQFIKPPECKDFLGSEILINESQEAKLNTKQLAEELRDLWERKEGYEEKYSKQVIKVNLHNSSGEAKQNFELKIDKENLEQIIYQRIEKGIINFFESLRRALDREELKDVGKINIFLAGNSSKSKVVKEIFEKYIEEETKNIGKSNKIDNQFFELFPALGTDEAKLKQEERGIKFSEDEIRPTGKTGVAFGLVKSRKGGRIRVIDNNLKDDKEAQFKYFLGINKKGKFTTIVDRNTEYFKWHKFISADEEDFELYYSSLPEASKNEMSIKNTERKKLRIDVIDEESDVWIRAISPTKIEIVVAKNEEIIKNEFKSNKIIELC